LTLGSPCSDAPQLVEEHARTELLLHALEGATIIHYTAMLAFLLGRAESTFDWSLRPLFLRFNTPSETERQAAITELRALTAAGQTP
jgi:hypothetical protein